MADWSKRLGALALAAGVALGCSGGAETPNADPASTATPGAPAEPPATPPSADQPPPEVQLTWLPGGGLALENAGAASVSLAREVTLQAGEGSAAEPLQLGLDCAVAPSAGPAACITLVPGAALAIGRWPDSHGACRCPPCLSPHASSSFTIQTCDQGQTVSRSLPER